LKSFSATSKQQILAKKHVALVALQTWGSTKKTISISMSNQGWLVNRLMMIADNNHQHGEYA
jgi:hypothetical protein